LARGPDLSLAPVRRLSICALITLALLGCARGSDAESSADPTVGLDQPTSPTTPAAVVPDESATSTSTPETPHGHPLAGKVIVIDPGHNGANGTHPAEINQQVFIGNGSNACDTTGTQTNAGYQEFDFNMDVSNRLARLLEDEGARVVLTRSDNRGWGPCITERAAIGNEAGADLAISIHADGGPASGRGFHVLVPGAVPGYNDGIVAPSAEFGKVLRDTYGERTGMPPATYIGRDGLMVRTDLGGLNLSTVPKVFLETGNMRNATDAQQLADPTFRQTIATAVSEAMTTYFAGSD
jgi:N-acetylmuramoyl-L-alanine amidase